MSPGCCGTGENGDIMGQESAIRFPAPKSFLFFRPGFAQGVFDGVQQQHGGILIFIGIGDVFRGLGGIDLLGDLIQSGLHQRVHDRGKSRSGSPAQ